MLIETLLNILYESRQARRLNVNLFWYPTMTVFFHSCWRTTHTDPKKYLCVSLRICLSKQMSFLWCVVATVLPRNSVIVSIHYQDELRKLLASLTEANELAARLRERSAEMIRLVGQDVEQLKCAKLWTRLTWQCNVLSSWPSLYLCQISKKALTKL